MLKRIGLFLGWLTSVLAGISAVFYSFGFIAEDAQQKLLGLDWASTSRDTVWYLGRGATVLAALGAVAALVLPVAITVLETMRWLVPRAGRVGAALARGGVWWIAVALVGLNLWLLALMAPLNSTLTSVLFELEGHVCSGENTLLAMVAERATDALLTEASYRFALVTVILTLAGYAVQRFTGEGTEPAVPMVICLVAGFTAALSVPMTYGRLMDEVELRPLTETAGLPAPLTERTLYHVASAAGGIWVWEPASTDVHWIDTRSYSHVGYGAGASLRAAGCR